jgi:hypothetical protein
MKNVYRVPSSDVIHNFKQIGIGIKPDHDIFVVMSFHGTVIEMVVYCPSDVFFGNPMLKCGFIEFNDNMHGYSIPGFGFFCNGAMDAGRKTAAIEYRRCNLSSPSTASAFSPPVLRGFRA